MRGRDWASLEMSFCSKTENWSFSALTERNIACPCKMTVLLALILTTLNTIYILNVGTRNLEITLLVKKNKNKRNRANQNALQFKGFLVTSHWSIGNSPSLYVIYTFPTEMGNVSLCPHMNAYDQYRLTEVSSIYLSICESMRTV